MIPISFALDCVYGVYDLAERKLETYHTKFGTYKQLQKNHEEIQLEKKKSSSTKAKEKKKRDKEKWEKQEREKEDRKRKENQEQTTNISISPPPTSQGNPNTFTLLRNVTEVAVRKLSMRAGALETKSAPKKVKYFQYTHMIIPLYKYPGNALVTIFLPVMLLAMLSLAIFFQ